MWSRASVREGAKSLGELGRKSYRVVLWLRARTLFRKWYITHLLSNIPRTPVDLSRGPPLMPPSCCRERALRTPICKVSTLLRCQSATNGNGHISIVVSAGDNDRLESFRFLRQPVDRFARLSFSREKTSGEVDVSPVAGYLRNNSVLRRQRTRDQFHISQEGK